MKKYIAFLRGIGSGKPLFKGFKDKLKLTLLNATCVRIGKCPDQLPAGRGSVKRPRTRIVAIIGGLSENKI